MKDVMIENYYLFYAGKCDNSFNSQKAESCFRK